MIWDTCIALWMGVKMVGREPQESARSRFRGAPWRPLAFYDCQLQKAVECNETGINHELAAQFVWQNNDMYNSSRSTPAGLLHLLTHFTITLSHISYTLSRSLVLVVVIDLVVPAVIPSVSTTSESPILKSTYNSVLSPSPHGKFFVLMFWYGYSTLSSNGGRCFQCSQCSSQRFQALMPPRMRQGVTTLGKI
jgi:hypothetical protein